MPTNNSYINNLVSGYKRVWHSPGLSASWEQKIGWRKRTTAGALKTIELLVTPFNPQGMALERMRLGIIEPRTVTAAEAIVRAREHSGLSPDNIVHKIIEIESELFTPQEVTAAYKILGDIVRKVKGKLREGMEPEDKLALVYRTIEKKGFKRANPDGHLFITCLLKKILICDASSFILLAVAQEQGWPVSLVSVPEHVFARWEDNAAKFNFDFGKIHPDELYFKQYLVAKTEPLDENGVLALVFHSRGSTKAQSGRYAEAIMDFDEAIRLNPKNEYTFANRGNYKARIGRYDEALADYDEAIRLNPRFALAYINRGRVKALLGRYEETIADCNEAIRLNPKAAIAFSNRGAAKVRLGRYEEAIADCNEAIGRDPKYATAFMNRGDARFKLGQNEAAIADYEEAIKLNPKSAEVIHRLSVARQKLNS